MNTFKRPMKAASLIDDPSIETTDDNILKALEKLRYPKWVTIKKDGIRAERLSYNGQPALLSYWLKPIRNKEIVSGSLNLLPGFDMELFNGDLTFQEITSRVMSEVHEDSAAIQYHLLDVINFSLPYAKRIELINDWIMLNHWSCDRVMFEIPRVANSAAELMEMFLESERRLQEGLCFRSPDSPYKQGRSTLREEWLIKLCRWKRIECEIIGFEEQVANANAESRNGIGLMDRSTDSANMIGKGTLGALWVQDIYNRKFKVGSGVGMTEKLRQEIWDDTDKWAGKRITIKYKPTGEKNLPRHPVYCGLREKGY